MNPCHDAIRNLDYIYVGYPDEPPLMRKVGDEVHDDLTNKCVKIVRLEADACGAYGVWVDDPYLGGGRFPWEVWPCS